MSIDSKVRKAFNYSEEQLISVVSALRSAILHAMEGNEVKAKNELKTVQQWLDTESMYLNPEGEDEEDE